RAPNNSTMRRPGSAAIVAVDPFPIGAAGHAIDPIGIFQIPLDGLAYATFKCLAWLPTKLLANFLRIHSISAVVARTIFDKNNLLSVGRPVCSRLQLVKNGADRSGNVHVCHFATATNI